MAIDSNAGGPTVLPTVPGMIPSSEPLNEASAEDMIGEKII